MGDSIGDIDRLRREGPAYSGDEEWEELPPGPMDVVLSVRVDASTMRQVAALARATNRTPSGLIRDWTVERLAGLAAQRPAELAGHRISEAALAYPVGEELLIRENEELRARYQPASVRWLFVGESSPASGQFFYRANSNLFHATREAFAKALGPMPPGNGFLGAFRDRGAWLVDLADRPVNRHRGRPRADAVDAGVGRLADVLGALHPELVIGVKSTLEGPIRRAAHLAQLPAARVHILQFPVRQWRQAYIGDLATILEAAPEHGSAAPPAADLTATLHEAIRAVLGGAHSPLPARAIANEINRRQLYERADKRSLDYQQVLARARRYPGLFEVTSGGVRLR